MPWPFTVATFFAAATAPPPCSLNGELVNGACKCDAPWSGPECATMNFKPVTFPQGYGMAPNLTTWGGNVLSDATTGRFHMYVSAMTNGCPLRDWTQNSRIDHAVAEKLEGPYTFADVAVPTWAHNAAPIALPDGSYAIVHIGTGEGKPDGGKNCSSSSSSSSSSSNAARVYGMVEPFGSLTRMTAAALESAAAGHAHGSTKGSTIHVSKSLAGPWAPLQSNTLGGCNNPAPWVHSNGTLFIVCGLAMKRADNISGPWTTVRCRAHWS